MMTITDFTKEYQAAVKRYRKSNTPAVKDLLTTAEIVYQAKESLSPQEWHTFCRQNDLGVGPLKQIKGTKKGRLRKQLLKIGRAAHTLRQFADSLPAGITYLEYLAPVPADTLKDLIASGDVHPMMTLEACRLATIDTRRRQTPGSVLPALTKRAKAIATAKSRGYSITIDFYTADFDVRKAASFVRTLKSFISKHGPTYGLVDDLRLSPALEVDLAEAARVPDAA
jgi:hypothetical protein